ncbi:TPA: ATP-binding cassette domain-containing protein, partial [Burkholderia cepacia ATCC 25416]|nr:ATP-binding cassette domain-containing protein [Burkholderia cepacia ATCC 25416]
PQAMRAILPTAFNDLISLAKGTSMVYVLAMPELFYTVQVIYRRNLEVIPLLMVATVWYLIILTVLSAIQVQVERHYARGALRNPPPSVVTFALARLGVLWRRVRSRRDDSLVRVEGDADTAAVAPRAGGEVAVHGVSKQFGMQRVLDNVSFVAPRGSVTVIVGPSGSGKSTLLRTINHLERVDDGFIDIDGELIGYRRDGDVLYELKERDVLTRRTAVGMVFQNFNLFPHLTVLENLIEAPVAVGGVTRDAAERIARTLLARVGLADKADAYPRQLSGGQQQRVAIARALALRPKVLLFDEPTSALDPELVNEVLDVIKELARSGTTLVIVTHEIGFAREVADNVLFMERGRIVESGPPAVVLDAPTHARTRAFLSRVL